MQSGQTCPRFDITAQGLNLGSLDRDYDALIVIHKIKKITNTYNYLLHFFLNEFGLRLAKTHPRGGHRNIDVSIVFTALCRWNYWKSQSYSYGIMKR